VSTTTTAHEHRWFIQNLARIQVAGEETGGAYAVVELTGPEGDMPPLHVHRREDEAFYVLEGRLTVFVGGEEIRLEAGDCAVAPRDVPHAYRVESPEARWLGFASPAGFDRFVLEASVPAESPTLPAGPPALTPDSLAQLAAGYGLELLGPPGALPAA
jgi:quercetin dioxygenase-like cupin family protein